MLFFAACLLSYVVFLYFIQLSAGKGFWTKLIIFLQVPTTRAYMAGRAA